MMTWNLPPNDIASIDLGGEAAHCATHESGKGGLLGGDPLSELTIPEAGQAPDI